MGLRFQQEEFDSTIANLSKPKILKIKINRENMQKFKLKKVVNRILIPANIALLIASCGSPGGTTGDNGGSSSSATKPSNQAASSGTNVLFASQYDRLAGEKSGAWTETKEDGLVYVSAGYDGAVQDVVGKWDYGWYEPNAEEATIRQSYGKMYAHDTALEENDTLYIAVQGPKGESLNISETDHLIIQMGNGADADDNPDNGLQNPANSHNIFTVTINGGTQNSDYSWSDTCSFDQNLSLSGNGYGLNTYYLDLGKFTCSGSLSTVKGYLKEVVVRVIGGKNPSADSSTSNNKTMPSVGFIAFSKTNAVGNSVASPYVLFASQYEEITGATSEPYIKSKEGGSVTGFNAGNFEYNNYAVTNEPKGLELFQGFGGQFKHSTAVTEADYFGWSVKGPGNGAVNVSATSKLVIQMGNGQQATGADAAANSHMVFTVDLKDDGTNLCTYDQTLADSSRPGNGGNLYGLQTYYIPLSSFSGANCDLSNLKNAVHEVAVKVEGGKDSDASGSTSGNETFLVFGFIGFTE